MDFTPRTANTPDKAIPRFSLKPVHMEFKSNEAGRPIYEDREFVEIITPGHAKSIPVEEVTAEHKARWPREYEAFKSGQELPTSGTPLEEWPAISASMALNLRGMHVRTVEDLAGLDDGRLQELGTGGRQMRDKAKGFLASAEGGAPLDAALSKVSAVEQENAMLKSQLAELAGRMEAMETKRGPGRPRREESEHAAA